MDFPIELTDPNDTGENEDAPKPQLIVRTSQNGGLRLVVKLPLGEGPKAPDGTSTKRVLFVGFPR